jgi:hypothetical protein
VAVGQLQADALSWSRAAAEDARIASWLAIASFEQLEFAPIHQLQADFEKARVQMERIVVGGGLAAATVSRTLTAAADAYLLDEIENVHAAVQIW